MMAPAESKLRAEAGVGALPRQALAQYLRLLRLYPVLTKAATRSAQSGRDGAGGGGRSRARTAGRPSSIGAPWRVGCERQKLRV